MHVALTLSTQSLIPQKAVLSTAPKLQKVKPIVLGAATSNSTAPQHPLAIGATATSASTTVQSALKIAAASSSMTTSASTAVVYEPKKKKKRFFQNSNRYVGRFVLRVRFNVIVHRKPAIVL
jgi:hypothetical protein